MIQYLVYIAFASGLGAVAIATYDLLTWGLQ
jgi:hypothetical protein